MPFYLPFLALSYNGTAICKTSFLHLIYKFTEYKCMATLLKYALSNRDEADLVKEFFKFYFNSPTYVQLVCVNEQRCINSYPIQVVRVVTSTIRPRRLAIGHLLFVLCFLLPVVFSFRGRIVYNFLFTCRFLFLQLVSVKVINSKLFSFLFEVSMSKKVEVFIEYW